MEQALIQYIDKLAAKPGNESELSNWYLMVICSLCASSQGALIVPVYEAAIRPYVNDPAARCLILGRIKEALLKSSVVYGLPRSLNGLFPLIKAVPDEEWEALEAVRKDLKNPYDLRERGEQYMTLLFGKSALNTMFGTLDKYHTDLRKLVIDYTYGALHSELSVLDGVTTSQCNLACLLPSQCMNEVKWHMRGILSNGGTVDDVQEALGIAIKISEITGIKLRSKPPAVEEVTGKGDIMSAVVLQEEDD